MMRWESGVAIVAASAFALLLAFDGGALAQTDDVDEAPAVVEQGAADEAAGTPLTEDELEVVVARIALYPDELVALVVAASLYPLQIVEAARYLDKLEADPELQPDEEWDGSVISLLNYPDLVRMMSDDLDWTQLLGDLALNQQKDLLVAIQQLRDEAVASGVLASNEQTVVVEDNDNIVIQSPDPEVVYVPQYPPEMLYDPTYVVPPTPIVYSDPYPSYYNPSARFWTGIVTGAAFGAIVDWNDWGVWGGDVDVDIDIDGNKIKFEGGDRNINLKNVDRSKIDIDRTNVKNTLKKNDFNNINKKVSNRNIDKSRVTTVAKGKDVRQNIQAGLKDGPAARPKPPVHRPDAGPGTGNRPNLADRGGANVKPASRPSTADLKKKVSAPKPGARPDRRPAKPSVLGDKGKGKPVAIASKRGHKSRGGGIHGGGAHKGGGIKRGGGRRR